VLGIRTCPDATAVWKYLRCGTLLEEAEQGCS